MTQEDKIRWFVIEESTALIKAAADLILASAQCAILEHDRFSLVLAGGTTPREVYERLAQSDAQWDKWHLYYGDERCLPSDDDERNSEMVRATGLSEKVAAHFSIPAELGAERAAEEYESLIESALPFDLVLLGMGEDGHTASLFPGYEIDDSRFVVPVHDAPKPPPDRVSLTPKALGQCNEMMVLVTGAAKADALRRWVSGEELPVSRVTSSAQGPVTVLTDQRQALDPEK